MTFLIYYLDVIMKFIVYLILKFVLLSKSVYVFSPASHLHFSIKHPHTLSWEYYTMFQCKAHLVMRLIENRISMEFMLQVSVKVKDLTVKKDVFYM